MGRVDANDNIGWMGSLDEESRLVAGGLSFMLKIPYPLWLKLPFRFKILHPAHKRVSRVAGLGRSGSFRVALGSYFSCLVFLPRVQEQSIIPVHSSCYSAFFNYLSISLFVSFFDFKNSRSFRSTLLDFLPLSSPEFRNSRSFRSTLLATPSFSPLWVSRTVDHSGPLFLLPPPSS